MAGLVLVFDESSPLVSSWVTPTFVFPSVLQDRRKEVTEGKGSGPEWFLYLSRPRRHGRVSEKGSRRSEDLPLMY